MIVKAKSGIVFLWLIFCFSFTALGQQTTLTGTITDSQTNMPVEGVLVITENSGKSTLSDKNGHFELRTQTDPAGFALIFSHLNYQPLRFNVSNGQTNFNIALLPRNHTLSEITISANNKLKPEKVKSETILDYAILNNQLFVLSWEEGHQNPALQAWDISSDKLLWTYTLPFYAEQLFVDCLGKVHLLTESSTYQLDLESDTISLFAAAPRSEYELYMQPCLTSVDRWVYFRQNQNKGITTAFHAIHQDKNEPKLLCIVQDEAVMRMQQDEQRFQFSRTAMAKEGGNTDAARLASNAAQSTYFAEKVLFRAPYVPLVKFGQQVLVFDHVNGKILTYLEENLTRTIPISYHLKKHWSEQVIVDEVQMKTYTTFNRNGITELKLLNLDTGELENTYRLPNPFAHKISVVNDTVYFLYRDPAKNHRQFLYQAAL